MQKKKMIIDFFFSVFGITLQVRLEKFCAMK